MKKLCIWSKLEISNSVDEKTKSYYKKLDSVEKETPGIDVQENFEKSWGWAGASSAQAGIWIWL